MGNPEIFNDYNLKLIKQAVAVLQQRGVSTSCPTCRSTDINVDIGAFSMTPINYNFTDVTNEIPVQYKLYPPSAASSFPALALTCLRCGNTQLFNLRILGVVRDVPSPTPAPNVGSGVSFRGGFSRGPGL